MSAQLVVALLLLTAACKAQGVAADLILHDAQVSVHFSPKGGAQDALVDEIRKAKESVYVQAYSFTSVPIIIALIEAHKRGVNVEIILDKGQRTDPRSGTANVREAGIATFIDSKHAIAHNKVMVIDEDTVVTGSFNYTKGAEEKNAENLLVVRSSELARLYRENWEVHKKHSE